MAFQLAEADSKIREFQHERNMEIKKIGIRSILIGLLVASPTILAMSLVLWPLDRGSIAYANRGVAVVACVGLYGLWEGWDRFRLFYLATNRFVNP